MDGSSRKHPPDSFREIAPRPALVVPRVRPDDGGEVLPIEDRIRALLQRRLSGVVRLAGPFGSGKTTALAHLRCALPPDAPVRVFDDVAGDDWCDVIRAGNAGLAVISTPETPREPPVAVLTLTPWTDDDLIEYLLAVHRPKCQAVMFKVKSYAQHFSLDGSPQLWSAVLDTMA
jgi:hypothetical protein